MRATGKLHLDVTGTGGVTAANEATHAPSDWVQAPVMVWHHWPTLHI